MMNDDLGLEQLFRSYRAACPDIEPGSSFMPNLWAAIEARNSFWFIFPRLARTVSTASAALCLLLLVLNLASSGRNGVLAPTYVDALMADHTAESTYYTEAIRK
ncbi:MAG: hypothetical protein WB992_10170 [Bryobacteraceae bacterium]